MAALCKDFSGNCSATNTRLNIQNSDSPNCQANCHRFRVKHMVPAKAPGASAPRYGVGQKNQAGYSKNQVLTNTHTHTDTQRHAHRETHHVNLRLFVSASLARPRLLNEFEMSWHLKLHLANDFAGRASDVSAVPCLENPSSRFSQEGRVFITTKTKMEPEKAHTNELPLTLALPHLFLGAYKNKPRSCLGSKTKQRNEIARIDEAEWIWGTPEAKKNMHNKMGRCQNPEPFWRGGGGRFKARRRHLHLESKLAWARKWLDEEVQPCSNRSC